MNDEVTLKMIYNEIKKVNEKLMLIEDIIEEVIIKSIPEAKLTRKQIERIKNSIQEMKKGNYVTLEEIKGAQI